MRTPNTSKLLTLVLVSALVGATLPSPTHGQIPHAPVEVAQPSCHGISASDCVAGLYVPMVKWYLGGAETGVTAGDAEQATYDCPDVDTGESNLCPTAPDRDLGPVISTGADNPQRDHP